MPTTFPVSGRTRADPLQPGPPNRDPLSTMALEKTITIKGDTDDAVKGIDDVIDSLDELSDSADDTADKVKDVGDSGKKTGKDLDKGFTQATKGVDKFKFAIKGVGLALKAAGIGLVLAALTKFQGLFFGDTITDSLTLAAESLNNLFAGQSFELAFKNAQETLRLQKEILINEKRLEKFQLEQQERAEIQRQIRDDVSKSIAERIIANNELSIILEKQLDAEKQIAEVNLEFARSRNETLGTQESLLELLSAEVKIAEINERITSQRSEQKVNEVALQTELNQLIETEGQIFDTIFKLDEARGIQLLENNKKRLEQEFESERTILDNRIALLEEGTQAHADALLERQNLENDFNVNSLIADREISQAKIQLDRDVNNAKFDIATATSALLGQLVEKDSALGKGLAVAQATISGIQGAQNAFTTASASPITTVFPAYPFIQAGLAAAFSAVQIKEILSTDPSGKGGASAPSSGGFGGAAAPSFSLVEGTGANQIASGLAGQNKPIQAFVVASDVSSGQALDRNIIKRSRL